MRSGRVAFFETDLDGVIRKADETFEDLVRQTSTVGRSLVEVFCSSDSEIESWLAQLNESGASFVVQIGTGSQVRWLDIRGRRVDSQIHGSLCDVTEDRQAIERYRTIVRQSPYYITIIQNEIVVYANDAQEALIPSRGKNPDEVLSSSLHPDDRALVLERRRRRAAGETVPPHYRYRAIIDGETRWFEIWTAPVQYNGELAVVAFSQDITHTIAIEEELRHAQKMDAIGRLAGGVAHDFNNLLTVIHASTTFAKRAAGGNIERELENIEMAAERAGELTRQLLLFSRRQPSEPVLLDIRDSVLRVERMLSRLVGAHFQIKLQIADEAMPHRIDEGQLEQLIINLVVNARDAMTQGGRIVISARCIDLAATQERAAGRYTVLAVNDEGPGIAPELLPKIFEPYFTTKEIGQGTGLGLATVAGIVARSGGFTSVESELGVGTTFQIHLPLCDETATSNRANSEQKLSSSAGRVLLVEDDHAVRTSVRRILETGGLVIDEAADGPTALEMLSAGLEVDIVLSDVMMPNMTGVELEEQILQRWPSVNVVLMSGYANSDAVPAKKAAQIVWKPFTPDALLSKLNELLHQN